MPFILSLLTLCQEPQELRGGLHHGQIFRRSGRGLGYAALHLCTHRPNEHKRRGPTFAECLSECLALSKYCLWPFRLGGKGGVRPILPKANGHLVGWNGQPVTSQAQPTASGDLSTTNLIQRVFLRRPARQEGPVGVTESKKLTSSPVNMNLAFGPQLADNRTQGKGLWFWPEGGI